MTNALRPTHTCFDDALDGLVTLLQTGTRPEHVRLVHGICHAPGDNEPFAHAWIECIEIRTLRRSLCTPRVPAYCVQGYALDGRLDAAGERIYIRCTIKDFAAMYNPTDVTRYTPYEAMRENERHNNFGPWKPQYLALCSADGRTWIGGTVWIKNE